jgi:hypothetical protein
VKPSEPIGATKGHAEPANEDPARSILVSGTPQSDLWVERDVAALIGCKREGGRPVRKLSAFQLFHWH